MGWPGTRRRTSSKSISSKRRASSGHVSLPWELLRLMGRIRSGLVIDEPWISQIFRGEKTWEMRDHATRKRERIALIRKGSGLIVGLATIVGAHGPLDDSQLTASFDKHRVPTDDIGKWRYAWVLEHVLGLPRPIRYVHKSGAVIWVTLDSGASQQASVSDSLCG